MRRRVEPDYWLYVWERQHPQGIVRAAWELSRNDGKVRVRAGEVILVLTEQQLQERIQQAEGLEERVCARFVR